MHFVRCASSKRQLPGAARGCATRRALVLVPAPPPSPLFQAGNACVAVLGALSGPYFKMSGLIPPALAIAYAVVVGRRGAPYFFTSFANVAMTSAMLSTDLRAIRALGRRMNKLEKKVGSGLAAVEQRFIRMDKQFVRMDTRLNRLEQQFTILLKLLERKKC